MCRFFKENKLSKRLMLCVSLLTSSYFLIGAEENPTVRFLLPCVLLLALAMGYNEALKDDEENNFEKVLRV